MASQGFHSISVARGSSIFSSQRHGLGTSVSKSGPWNVLRVLALYRLLLHLFLLPHSASLWQTPQLAMEHQMGGERAVVF